MLLLVAPTIKVEIDRAEITLLSDDEIGADVAHPDVIQNSADKGGVVTATQFFRQIPLMLAAQHHHWLVTRNGAGDQADGFLDISGEVFPNGLLCTKRNKGTLLWVALVRHEPVIITGSQCPWGAQAKAHRGDQSQGCGR
ncbi:hypothetical protein D3C77_487880 [compost metagenome]